MILKCVYRIRGYNAACMHMVAMRIQNVFPVYILLLLRLRMINNALLSTFSYSSVLELFLE